MTEVPPVVRVYPAHPVLAVSIAVFRDDRVLLATRTKPPLDDVYSLPGGVVEAGEMMQEATLRELWEEVQIEARVVGFNRHVEMIDRDAQGRVRGHYVVASYVGAWLAGEGTPGPEAGCILWADEAQLRSLKTTPDLRSVIASARHIFAGA